MKTFDSFLLTLGKQPELYFYSSKDEFEKIMQIFDHLDFDSMARWPHSTDFLVNRKAKVLVGFSYFIAHQNMPTAMQLQQMDLTDLIHVVDGIDSPDVARYNYEGSHEIYTSEEKFLEVLWASPAEAQYRALQLFHPVWLFDKTHHEFGAIHYPDFLRDLEGLGLRLPDELSVPVSYIE